MGYVQRVVQAGAAVLLIAAPLRALDSSKTLTQYAHRIWGQEEGLFQPTIYSILQTRDGFLWLGTQDSLIRFDGIHFREFEGAAEAGLQRTLIRGLAEDREVICGSRRWEAVRFASVPITRSGATPLTEGMPADDAFCAVPDAAALDLGLYIARSGAYWARRQTARFLRGRWLAEQSVSRYLRSGRRNALGCRFRIWSGHLGWCAFQAHCRASTESSSVNA